MTKETAVRRLSKIAPDWWDYTTLDSQILEDAGKLTEKDVEQLSRPGFTVKFYDTVEDFYLAEALEYITSWQQATASNPTGICGPIGPTEQLPLVARIVNEIGLSLKYCHFWGMDEWVVDDKEVGMDFELGFARTDWDLCFGRIKQELAMPKGNMHFPSVDAKNYIASWDAARCLVMQGGQGEIKHWAFNDPFKREGKYKDAPPTPEEYRKLGTRLVDLHPVTLMQNARTSGGGAVHTIPSQAMTVGPLETWRSEKVSIWHPGHHDNQFGIRLTAFMIAKKLPDSSVPMSLLADHPNVQFNYLRGALGTVGIDMH